MATNKSQPKLLNISQIAQIQTDKPLIGKALQSLVDYVNKTVTPPTGTRIAPRKPRTKQI